MIAISKNKRSQLVFHSLANGAPDIIVEKILVLKADEVVTRVSCIDTDLDAALVCSLPSDLGVSVDSEVVLSLCKE